MSQPETGGKEPSTDPTPEDPGTGTPRDPAGEPPDGPIISPEPDPDEDGGWFRADGGTSRKW